MKRLVFAIVLLSLPALPAVETVAQVPSGPGDWPQWRGPNRDGISSDTGLLKEWPENGPKLAWQVDSVGVGYSSLVVKDGRVFTQGDLDGVEHVIALDAKDGKLLWAVQPAPVVSLLKEKLASEIKRLDTNNDGMVTEVEALARFGWKWNDYNKPADEELDAIAARRSAVLLKELDKDGDGTLSYDEAGRFLQNEWQRIDRADKDAVAEALAGKRTVAYLKALDKDEDGSITRQESRGSWLDRQFGRFDERDPNTNRGDDILTTDEIKAALIKFEAGQDGAISNEELRLFYVATRANGDGVLSDQELRVAIGGYRNGMGDGPRGTPTVDGSRLYAEGGNGDLVCLDVETGETLWYVNLSSDFGGGRPGWGYSESPLIAGDFVIVTPGGKGGTLVALNKENGDVAWQSAELNEGAHYSSPTLANINGVQQVVQFARQSVFGVTLADGKPLWNYTAPANGTANCCSPIIDGNLVFASSGYGTGGGLAKVTLSGSIHVAEEVYFEKKMACHHGGIVKVGDYMYSCGSGTLICMEFATGDIKWQARGAGKGSLCYADGMLYMLGEGHTVALAEATPEGYHEAGQFKIEGHGRPAWAHPIVAGGKFYIRDQESLRVYNVSAK
ncbi:MAG: PQQ-binding-like beta-propeller repeat protein [Planctomycetota bacterium]|nr:PQQ-binding-like beta-propeller repeat protein [Planctomycetota bacterium]